MTDEHRDPFEQPPPHDLGADPYREPLPAKPPRERRPGYERIALWWRSLFPICSFFGGLLILLIEALFPRLRSDGMIGVGLVLAGLGPAGLIDVIRKMPG